MTPEQIKLIEDGRWQPIEKAPKDKFFLTISDGAHYHRAKWETVKPNPSDYYEAETKDIIVAVDELYQPSIMDTVTHFRPLPNNYLADALEVALEHLIGIAEEDECNVQDMLAMARHALAEIQKIAERNK